MNPKQMTEALLRAKRTLSLAEVCQRTNLSREQAKQVLNECVSEGLLVSPRDGKYCHPSLMKLVLCTTRSNQNAPVFARPADGGNDFYLDMPHVIAFDGDLIFVRETQGGERRRGTLVSIVRRAHKIVTGTLYIEHTEPIRKRHRSKGRPHYVPEDKYYALLSDGRFPRQAIVSGDHLGAQSGDMCVFEIVRWPLKNGKMVVEVKQILGKDSDISAYLSALCALHNINEEFSQGTAVEAERLKDDPQPADIAGRLDLRDDTVFTIDGADAQDFDDAVSLRRMEYGYELGVHIADVSYYVRPGSELDAEARNRGTSVYLPGRTIPMLPEKLCNCLCSLLPGRDRLTLSAILQLDRQLNVSNLSIRPSVIRSCARLTYEDVNEMFADRPNTVPSELHAVLKEMNDLAKRLHEKRVLIGSLDLNLPEVDFELDAEGYPVSMGTRQRGDAQRLIEEFMLMANQAVAAHAEKTELPFPYRVHDKPDSEKLEALELLLIAMNHPLHVGANASQQRLQAVLDAFRGTSQEIIVSSAVLRSMSKARYSEKNLGHFGLAFKDYCHFTSPIRRYPDLLAHRMLRLQMSETLSEERALSMMLSMHTLTEEASLNEEQATLCEREADRLMCAAYLSRNKQKTFCATVTHLGKKGAFVDLGNGCDGFLPYRNMDDIYTLDETGAFIAGKRMHRMIHLGETLKVRCSEADIDTGSIEFCMVSEARKRS